MPKKSAKKVFIKEQDIVKYRWEFFIRNPKNRKKIDKVISFLEPKLKPIVEKFPKTKKKLTNTKSLANFIRKFYKKISQISIPKDITNIFKELEKELGPYHIWSTYAISSSSPYYKMATSEIRLFVYFNSLLFRGLIEQELFKGKIGYTPAISLSYNPFLKSSPEYRKKNYAEDFYPAPIIDFRVDLTFPKEDIVAHIEGLINAYKKRFSLDRKQSEPRKKMELYTKYLKVWDMVHDNKSWKEIAKDIFPNDGDLENAKRKAHIYFRRCEKLIKGDYRLLK